MENTFLGCSCNLEERNTYMHQIHGCMLIFGLAQLAMKTKFSAKIKVKKSSIDQNDQLGRLTIWYMVCCMAIV